MPFWDAFSPFVCCHLFLFVFLGTLESFRLKFGLINREYVSLHSHAHVSCAFIAHHTISRLSYRSLLGCAVLHQITRSPCVPRMPAPRSVHNPRPACRTAPPHMRAHHPPGTIAAGSPPHTRRRHSITRHDPHMSRPRPTPGGGWEATPHAQPPRPRMRTTIGSGRGAVGGSRPVEVR